MNKNILKMAGIGVIAMIAIVGAVLFMQRGARLDLPGHVLKIRTAALSDDASVVIVDFRISNTSDFPGVVRNVLVYDEDKSGGRVAGRTVADSDAKRIFEGIPLLGEKYNKSLILEDKIPGHATWDRMIASTFEMPEAKLAERKRFVVTVEEIDGKIFEIPEN